MRPSLQTCPFDLLKPGLLSCSLEIVKPEILISHLGIIVAPGVRENGIRRRGTRGGEVLQSEVVHIDEAHSG